MKNNEYDLWINNKNLDLEIRRIIEKYDSNQIEKYFNNSAQFGTAGLRALMGYGSAMFNIITVKKAALGYGKYLREVFSFESLQNKGVVICHDNRKNSELFALQSAYVLNSFKIKVFLSPNNSECPTPLVSYLIKKLKLIGGVMITASHNPKDYNGFKIFNAHGYQCLPITTKIIQEEFEKNTTEAINFKKNEININYFDQKLIEQYCNDVLALQKNSQLNKKIRITFSNLHGVTQKITPYILKKAGYQLNIVEKLYDLDPNFTNAPFPNPEIEANYLLPIKSAQECNSDLIILNDPDGDRIGVCVKLNNNQYKIISTNDLAALLADYIFSNLKKSFHKRACYNSVVSSSLISKIAKDYDVASFKTLTGFKWMGHLIVQNKNYESVFAFEEACGIIINPKMVKDKDGIATALIVAEMANYYKLKKLNLFQALEEIFLKYNYYYHKTIAIEINQYIGLKILNFFRHYSYHDQSEFELIKKIDFLRGYNNFARSNLLKFYFKNHSWFAMRMSGTEPKIKIYFETASKESLKNAQKKYELLLNSIQNKIKYFKIKIT